MIVVEYDKIELDYCTNCMGVWFDAGELELLVERMALEDSNLALKNVLSAAEAKTVEKKRRCPICRYRMKKVDIGEPEVLIDACPIGEGLWFDGGEVRAVIDQCARRSCATDEVKGRVLTFLGDTLKSARKPDKH